MLQALRPPENDCPFADQITSYVQCTLERGLAVSLEMHLTSCPSCQSVLSQVMQAGIGPDWFDSHRDFLVKKLVPAELAETRYVGAVTSLSDNLIGDKDEILQTLAASRYQRVRLCGEGGMGQVWEGWDSVMKRRVAIKQLRAAMNSAGQRILQEASSLARLSHPHIVSIYEMVLLDERPALVMQFVDGSLLSATNVWNNTTIADLGLTPGSYTWTWSTDSVTLNIEATAVPEPTSIAFMSLGGLALAASSLRRHLTSLAMRILT